MDNTVLLNKIGNAKTDVSAANDLITDYLPFIKSETTKFIKRAPIEGTDDELNIAMFAFYECILSYENKKGSFFNLAEIHIRHRLIDFYRKEKRHIHVLSIDAERQNEDEGYSIRDELASEVDHIENKVEQLAGKAEIDKFTRELESFGMNLSDVAQSCPKQERTLISCLKVLNAARENSNLIDIMLNTGKLPISGLSKISKVDPKIIERHRKYIIAIILAYTNGFDLIREHLNELRAERRNYVVSGHGMS